MSFQKDFDTLYQQILTDWQNQFPQADLSKGSLINLKAACLASALWGLYKYQDWISRQIFPDTAETAYLEHHAWVRGISRTGGETDAALLERYLDYIRRPPAGGNKYDYVKWAKEVDDVRDAFCLPLYMGLGTVGLVVVANEATTGSAEPDAALLAAVQAHIDDVRPVTASAVYLLPAVIIEQNITATVSGTGVDLAAVTAAITGYMNALAVGRSLFLSQLIVAAIQAGVDNIVISVPAADVVPAHAYEIIRPGTIDIQEV